MLSDTGIDIFQGETLNKLIHLFTRNSSGPSVQVRYFIHVSIINLRNASQNFATAVAVPQKFQICHEMKGIYNL